MLRFQANACVLHMIAGIELDSRLARAHFHDPARFRIAQARGCFSRVPFRFQHIIMIVTVQLRVELAEACPEPGRFREIERRPLLGDAARGNCFTNCVTIELADYRTADVTLVSLALDGRLGAAGGHAHRQ